MKKMTEKDLERQINKQFEIAGHKDIDYKQIKKIDEWFMKYTITKKQEEEFKKWLKKDIAKFVYKQRIDKEYGRWVLMYGLKKNG